MTPTPLNEVSRYRMQINKGEAPSFTWEHNILTIQTDKNVSICKISHNIQCIDKKIDWIVKDIPTPKTSPATSFFTKEFLLSQKISNMEYTQLMLDTALWPHSDLLMEEMASVVSYQWSPPNFIYNNESVIAVLNNIGNIELFGPDSCGYTSILNLSSLIERKYREKSGDSVPKDVAEAKTAADAVETAAFCWGTQINDKFIFVTAQKNGDIFFWQLSCDNNGINTEELLVQTNKEGEIITMHWIPLSQDTFLLFVTNIFGQLYVFKYQWENECLKLINCDCLWPHKDRMVIKHLKYKIVNDTVIIVCSKHRHLVVLLMDHSCNKLAEYLININDYKITVITEGDTEFYIGMMNCKILKLNITVKNSNLNVNLEEIIIKENLANHDLCGLQFSRNNIICALGVVNRKLMYRKENVCLDIIFLTKDESHEKEMTLLLENPTKSLTDYWDCIEMIRCKTMSLRILPFMVFDQLYSNKSSMYELKVYHILLSLYHSLEKVLKNKSKGWLPETSLEVVKDKLLVLQASSLIEKLSKRNQVLEGFDLEQFVGANRFLQYYSEKYKANLSDLIASGMHNIKEDIKYTCQCCEAYLQDFTCPNGHLNMFCALSFTPIESDEYLKCEGCGVIARKELLPENPMCVFCDLYLNYCTLPT